MPIQDYSKTAKDLMRLLAFALGGESPGEAFLSAMDPEHLMELAKKHSLGVLMAYALEKLGRSTPETTSLLAAALRREILFEEEKRQVMKRLSEAGIWHMPLKGSILKAYYPAPYLREMVDVDILYDESRTRDVQLIMKGRGFKEHRIGKGVVDEYYKQPLYNFEMHRELFASNVFGGNSRSYYKNLRNRLQTSSEDPCCLVFSPEDFYIYFVVHANKHYSKGGTGLRTLVDTAVFCRRYEKGLDGDYVHRELQKLGSSSFEQMIRSLTRKLIREEQKALTPDEEEALVFIATSGTYGSTEHHMHKAMAKGKLRYIKKNVFLPMATVKDWYPFFYRHKMLLPLLPFWRLLKGIFVYPWRIKAAIKHLFSRKKPSHDK